MLPSASAFVMFLSGILHVSRFLHLADDTFLTQHRNSASTATSSAAELSSTCTEAS
jgi:hypothetical protein